MTQPDSQDAVRPTEARPTQVWFVQGKKANKDFRSALALHRQEATLYEARNVNKVNPEQDEPQETQHNVAVDEHERIGTGTGSNPQCDDRKRT